jgi:hypothetical protein
MSVLHINSRFYKSWLRRTLRFHNGNISYVFEHLDLCTLRSDIYNCQNTKSFLSSSTKSSLTTRKKETYWTQYIKRVVSCNIYIPANIREMENTQLTTLFRNQKLRLLYVSQMEVRIYSEMILIIQNEITIIHAVRM